MEQGKTVVVQFKNSGGLGSLNELDWRHQMEDRLDGLLSDADLGYCDGGQSGAGSMEVFLYVSDVMGSVELVKQYLTDEELIGWAKIAHFVEGGDGGKWVIDYPKSGQFDIWQWIE
jgi:hypothetical protein